MLFSLLSLGHRPTHLAVLRRRRVLHDIVDDVRQAGQAEQREAEAAAVIPFRQSHNQLLCSHVYTEQGAD